MNAVSLYFQSIAKYLITLKSAAVAAAAVVYIIIIIIIVLTTSILVFNHVNVIINQSSS